MDKIRKRIDDARNIKESSLNTYMSCVKKLFRELKEKDETEPKNLDFIKDYDKVIETINSEKSLSSKKIKLTTVLVLLGIDEDKDKAEIKELYKKFNTKLQDLNNQYMSFLKEQRKTPAQEKNWVEFDKIIKITNNLMQDIKNRELQDKKELTNQEFRLLQQYVVLRTYLTFPIRNDFADMKVLSLSKYNKLPEEERRDNNFLVINKGKKEFRLNQFKNIKTLGSRVYKIPAKLNRVINLWFKFNTSGYYLVKKDRVTPLTPNGITKFFNVLFKKYTGKLVSTSLLRHIMISHHLKNEKTLKEIEAEEKKVSDLYMHSKRLNNLYRKIDRSFTRL